LVAAEDADPEHAERLILSPYNSKFAKTKQDKKHKQIIKKCRVGNVVYLVALKGKVHPEKHVAQQTHTNVLE